MSGYRPTRAIPCYAGSEIERLLLSLVFHIREDEESSNLAGLLRESVWNYWGGMRSIARILPPGSALTTTTSP